MKVAFVRANVTNVAVDFAPTRVRVAKIPAQFLTIAMKIALVRADVANVAVSIYAVLMQVAPIMSDIFPIVVQVAGLGNSGQTGRQQKSKSQSASSHIPISLGYALYDKKPRALEEVAGEKPRLSGELCGVLK